MTFTLVLVRHAKSDWTSDVDDLDRPLSPRGKRQAPPLGVWIDSHIGDVGLAVVSPAERAAQTWDLVRRRLSAPPPTTWDTSVYTFDGHELLRVVQGLPWHKHVVVIVGHNPAMEELVEILTGESHPMATSTLAVIQLPEWGSVVPGLGRLRALGRPADGPVTLAR